MQNVRAPKTEYVHILNYSMKYEIIKEITF